MNKVLIVNLLKKREGVEKNIKTIASKVLKILKKDEVYLEIYLISSQKMYFLNKKYRCKNKPANILSFKEPEKFFYPGYQKRIGEIFLNISAISDKEKLTLFLIHGILHLFGYEHKTKSDRIRMEKKEPAILKLLKQPSSLNHVHHGS